MPHVNFLRSYDVAVGDGEPPERYAEGQTVELDEASARHFTKRGAAEIVEKPKGKPSAQKPKNDEKAGESK